MPLRRYSFNSLSWRFISSGMDLKIPEWVCATSKNGVRDIRRGGICPGGYPGVYSRLYSELLYLLRRFFVVLALAFFFTVLVCAGISENTRAFFVCCRVLSGLYLCGGKFGAFHIRIGQMVRVYSPFWRSWGRRRPSSPGARQRGFGRG